MFNFITYKAEIMDSLAHKHPIKKDKINPNQLKQTIKQQRIHN